MALSTSSPPSPIPVPVTVEEIERRIRWPALPALLFVGILIGLGIVALVGTRREPPVLAGLPDDPDVRAAAELVRGVALASGPLRLEPALWTSARPAVAGASHGEGRVEAAMPEASESWIPTPRSREESAAIERASQRLAVAEERHPRDVRVLAAFGALGLAAGSLESAEQRYQRAVDRAPGYGEARLGLGVTLAMIGARAVSATDQRRLTLRAIAQLAAVRPNDPAHEAALYDRIVLLERVGREADAARYAREFRSRYPGSAWIARVPDHDRGRPR